MVGKKFLNGRVSRFEFLTKEGDQLAHSVATWETKYRMARYANYLKVKTRLFTSRG